MLQRAHAAHGRARKVDLIATVAPVRFTLLPEESVRSSRQRTARSTLPRPRSPLSLPQPSFAASRAPFNKANVHQQHRPRILTSPSLSIMELRLLLLLLAVGCAVGAGMGDVPTQCWTQYLAAGPTGLDSLHTTQAMARRELAELRSLGCPQTSHPSVIVTLAPVSHPSSR